MTTTNKRTRPIVHAVAALVFLGVSSQSTVAATYHFKAISDTVNFPGKVAEGGFSTCFYEVITESSPAFWAKTWLLSDLNVSFPFSGYQISEGKPVDSGFTVTEPVFLGGATLRLRTQRFPTPGLLEIDNTNLIAMYEAGDPARPRRHTISVDVRFNTLDLEVDNHIQAGIYNGWVTGGSDDGPVAGVGDLPVRVYIEGGFPNLDWEVSGDSVTLTGISSATSGHLSIPQTIAGLPVRSIADSAFAGCSALKGVTFPDSISSIAGDALDGCSALEMVVFQGDAPTVDVGDLFSGASSALVVYHLTGAAGFDAAEWPGLDLQELATPPSPIQGWLLTYGLPLDEDIESDPFDNGASLLLAYALNVDPRFPHSGMPELQVSDSSTEFTYTFFGSQAGIDYTVLASQDSVHWSTEGIRLSEVRPDGTREATIDADSNNKLVRLMVNWGGSE